MESDARFRLMFERSGDAILLLDTSVNKFVEYNAAALQMLECSREELSALHPSELSPALQPDGRSSFEKAEEMIATAVVRGSHRFEWVHRSPHRDDFPVEVLLTPISTEGAPVLLVVWRDITERKRSEEALRQAQRLESLGVMAGGIAHDFNNLLTAVLGHLNIARRLLPAGHAGVAHLGRAEHVALKAADLTRQMLAYGGSGSLAAQPVDLSASVREMAELLSVTIPRGVDVSYHLPEGLPLIDADKAQVQQIIMNLVTNAAEAIGQAEGTITLRTTAERLDADGAQRDFAGQELRAGWYVSLEVRDTGKGMNPEILSRIFDPFFSTKRSGRGLGLSALRGIVRGHQGGFRVESDVGAGTCFTVLFPVSDAVRAATATPATYAPMGSDAKGTMLLVEDEPVVRHSMRLLLQSLGFEVLEAADGEEALECFASAARGRIGWVLMDLTMPRMDGHSAFLALRELDPTLKVILSSGWAEADLVARFRGAPPSAFLSKPFQIEELEAVLVKLGIVPARPAS